jgi:hypothetical protein
LNISLLFQLLFYSQVSEKKTLFAGGYGGNGRVTRNTFTYNVKSGELLAGDPIDVNYKLLGPLREPRKYMACGKFVENTGILVAVVVGGLDDSGNSLTSAEVYYDRYYINTKISELVIVELKCFDKYQFGSNIKRLKKPQSTYDSAES